VVPQNQGDCVMLRFLDIVLAGFGLLVVLPLMAVLFLIGLFDTGAPLFQQTRVGRYQKPFTLVKFRTMRPDTQSVASHLANPSAVTPLGAFLRRTKLDELPQLWNVLKGEMSLVGPRPCLFNQTELIEERASRGVFAARPGITGLAQTNGIDMSTPKLLAETDARMLQGLRLAAYFIYIIKTVSGAGRGDRIRQE
jgi:O-antigen biosynthesis protein WbqP